MSTQTAFTEFKKAQDILAEAIEKSAKTNLEAVEKLFEMNKQRLTDFSEAGNPSEVASRQASAFKDYVEFLSDHVQSLNAIGTESREQLTELSQEFAKGIDFSGFFPFGQETTTKGKSKSSKSS